MSDRNGGVEVRRNMQVGYDDSYSCQESGKLSTS